jgi:hypothetical protein
MMIVCYRIAYGCVVAVFFGNVLKTNYFVTAPHYVALLLIATAALLCGLFILLLGFFRIHPAVSWGIVLAWEAAFVWYGWFSPSAPFALHELHSLDPAMAAQETTAHFVRASAMFALLFVWFLSLPIVQVACLRRRRLLP